MTRIKKQDALLEALGYKSIDDVIDTGVRLAYFSYEDDNEN